MTDKIIKTIADAVAEGVPAKTAAVLAKVSPLFYAKWYAVGLAMEESMVDDGAYPADSGKHEWQCHKLYLSVTAAQADCASFLVKRVVAEDDWHAAAWWLQRQCREEFGAKAPVEARASSDEDGGVKVEITLPDNGR